MPTPDVLSEMSGMQVVILAGGLATRLGPLTSVLPKSMIPIEGKPFMEYQLDLLRQCDIKKVVLCVGYLHEQIEQYFRDGQRLGLNISYSYDGESLVGTGGALKRAQHLLNNEFFVMYGDSYLLLPYQEIRNVFQQSNKLGMMVVLRNRSQWDHSNIEIKNGLVSHYDTDKTVSGLEYIDEGLSILRKEALELLPAGQPASLGLLFSRLIEKGELAAYETQQRFYEIGSPSGMEEFSRFITERSH